MAKQPPLENENQDITLTLKDLIELVKSMNQAGSLDAEAIATIAAKASAQAAESLHPTRDIPYPGISPLNPEGQLANPLPELKGEIYWVGYRLTGDELTRQEIELLNRLTPGDFEIRSRAGDMLPFKVRDLDPGSRTSRRLLILFPCATADQRHNVPTMVDLLQQVLTPDPVPA